MTVRTHASPARGSIGMAGAVAVAASALLALAMMAIVAIAGVGSVSLGTASSVTSSPLDGAPSALAVSEIPPAYLRLYEQAAQRYGLSWAVLAGIGKVECDHGRDPDPSCTQEGVVNSAGAGGPMQFLASTWARYGVDGDGDGRIDRWSPADAIFSAANYLRAAGAPHDSRAAIFAYNHATWYVSEVEGWADRYSQQAPSVPLPGEQPNPAGADAALAQESPTPVRFIEGERAVLSPGDGHLALVPSGVPAEVQAMVVAGNELQDLEYGPGGHPDPRGSAQEDCSSTVNYVLYRAGVRPINGNRS